VITAVLLIISASTAYAAGITVPLNSTLDVNTGTLDVPGDITFAGTLAISTGTINLTGNWAKTGTFTAGTVK